MGVYGQQIFLCGVPGSGKTYYIQHHLERWLNYSLYDQGNPPKHRYEGDDLIIFDPYGEYTEITLWGNRQVKIGSKLPFFHASDPDEALEKAEDTAGALVVLDELMMVGREQKAFERIRKLSSGRRHREINLVAATQRPVFIPKETIALFDKLLIFHLDYDVDIETMAFVLSKEEQARAKDLSVGEYIYKERRMKPPLTAERTVPA